MNEQQLQRNTSIISFHKSPERIKKLKFDFLNVSKYAYKKLINTR